jgi:Suppressor of fused protein (SUFU)
VKRVKVSIGNVATATNVREGEAMKANQAGRQNAPDDIAVGINEFIKRNVGEIVQVFHELESDDLHVDIYHGRTNGDVRVQWLFTSGMSRRPMNVPPGKLRERFGELVICLPPPWPLNMDAFKSENYYWPVRLLKILARYPFQNNTWLSEGHSVPYGKAFAPNTKMSSALLMRPQLLCADPVVHVRDQEILLWAVCPLYEDESKFKQKYGFEALSKLLAKHGVTEMLDPDRASVVKQSDSMMAD